MRAPRHREAYPALKIREAVAAVAAGRPVCIYANERGTRVGQAFLVQSVTQDSGAEFLVFAYQFVGEHFRVPPETVTLAIMRVRNALGRERLFFRCRRCKGLVESLIFRSGWACGRCHRLIYRSQVIPHNVKAWEKVQELQAMIGDGRPHRMRQAKFQALQNQLEYLKKAAGKARGVASRRHFSRIETEWVSPMKEGVELCHPDYAVCNGEIVRQPPVTQVADELTHSDHRDSLAPAEPPPPPPAAEPTFKMDPKAVLGPTGKSYWRDDEE